MEYVALRHLCHPWEGISAGPSWSRLKAASPSGSGVPVVKPAALTVDGRILREGVERFPEEDAISLERFRLAWGDIVTVRQGSLGRQAVIRDEEDGWLFGPACLRIRLRKDAPVLPEYLAHFLGRAQTRDWLYAHASGQTVPTLTEQRLGMLPVLVLSLPEQHRLVDEVAQVDAQVRRHEQALGLLAELRTSLIERAVTPRP